MDFRIGRASDGSRDSSTIVGDAASAPAIRSGDMVVFFEGREAIGFDRMKAKGIWQCRHGAFHHDEIVGKPFGSRVFSRSTKGYVYALSGTPELWSHVVPNRTQIVQDFDQSIVIFRLDLKPGDVVIESGTGSGVMSSAIMRTIAPSGFLHSFEFNEIRATTAQEEFENNGLGGLAKVVHRDVCAGRAEGGGFGKELDGKADAVFLDLPEPWLAVEHAKLALKGSRKVCSYSPCIEQVMKTCEALRAEGFHSVTTIEFRLRTINYAEVQLEVPDFGLHHVPLSAPATPSASSTFESRSGVTSSVTSQTSETRTGVTTSARRSPVVRSVAIGEEEVDTGKVVAAMANRADGNQRDGSEHFSAVSGAVSDAVAKDKANTTPCTAGEGGVDSVEAVKELSQTYFSEGNQNGPPAVVRDERSGGDAVASQGGNLEKAGVGDSTAVSSAKKRPREEGAESAPVANGALEVGHVGRGRNERLQPKAVRRAAEAAAAERGGVRKPPSKLLCAQPYPIMRGHTAFLTFATTPVAWRPTAAVAAAQSASSAGGTSSVVDSTAAAAEMAAVAAVVE